MTNEHGAVHDSSVSDWQAVARSAASVEVGEGEKLAIEFLVCRIAGARYALPIEAVREIIRLRPITPLPRVPRWLLGVIALRGEVVQVIDMALRLGGEASPATRSTRIIVLHAERASVSGMRVDSVDEVLRVTEAEISAVAAGAGAFVTDLCVDGDDFVSVIDPLAGVGLDVEHG